LKEFLQKVVVWLEDRSDAAGQDVAMELRKCLASANESAAKRVNDETAMLTLFERSLRSADAIRLTRVAACRGGA
jgi:hypothetical protein